MSKTFLERLFTIESDRDKQLKIGPSEIGSPCDICVQKALFRTEAGERGRWWVAARIGTAVHLDQEHTIKDLNVEYGVSEKIRTECKTTVGHLEGYGDIRGSYDALIPPNKNTFYPTNEWTLEDTKTTDKDKLKWIKQAVLFEPKENENKFLRRARFNLEKYVGQGHMYARGVRAEGVPVEKILFSFLARDVKDDTAFFDWEIPFIHEHAESVWGRLEEIWCAGANVEYEAHPDCFEHGGMH